MNDIDILRRSILWDFVNRDLSAVANLPDRWNKDEIKAAMKGAYAKFIFVCGTSFDLATIEEHARALLGEMREPAIYAVSDMYSAGPDEIVDRISSEIVEERRDDRLFGRHLKP